MVQRFFSVGTMFRSLLSIISEGDLCLYVRVFFKTLLATSRTHNDVDMGKRAAEGVLN
jgi:hypothetical protein